MTHFAQIARTNVAVALFSVIAIANTIAPAQASDRAGAKQLAQQICRSVIGVHPGESHFDGCTSSLSDSLESISRGRVVAQARNACFAQGLKPGSADLSLCLLQAADTTPDPAAVKLPDIASMTAGIAADPQSTKSYFAVTPSTKFHREQQACAMLGFDPAFGAFANCVADLQGTLQAIDASEG
ncbi:MAG TPA: hypothetical protein VGF56_08895 [Rhizomicrobium sp.]|jgi:hypothetical protein